MKKTILLLALTMMGAEACATAPYEYKYDPMCKIITVPRPKDTFFNRMAFISQETGVKINFDVASLGKHGITKNQVLERLPPNQPAIDLVIGFCKAAETQPDVIVIRREDDGSLTITAK